MIQYCFCIWVFFHENWRLIGQYSGREDHFFTYTCIYSYPYRISTLQRSPCNYREIYQELPEIYPPLGITIWFGVSCVLLVDAMLNIIHFAPTNVRFKRSFSGLGKLLTTENRLKMMKNAFYFIEEVLFVLEIFTFLYGVFDYVEKRLDEKAEINYSSTNIYNTHIAQYLKK